MIPIVSIPLKQTQDVDFGDPFRDYIQSHYQEDPSDYQPEIRLLNDIRNQMVYAIPTTEGRDILYKYFGQLELLSLRFPIDDANVKIDFEWKDAFSGVKVIQNAIAFEKACVLFNIGAMLSLIASKEDLQTPEGLKKACAYYQTSAGVLQFINDNFLHPPSIDLSRESINLLVTLLLCQAQECFIQKLGLENKQGMLVSRMSKQLTESYKTIRDLIVAEDLGGQFESWWLVLIDLKAKYYSAVSNYHYALHMEKTNDFQSLISFLTLADKDAKEALMIAEGFRNNSKIMNTLNFFASSDQMSLPNSLHHFAEELQKTITLRYLQGVKDNDVIYLCSIVGIESLPVVEKIQVAKCLSFSELLPRGEKDLERIIGDDIFTRLVPIGIHESASVYSDSKDTLMRKCKNMVEDADQELQVNLESLEIFQTLAKLKASAGFKIPDKLVERLLMVGRHEGLETLKKKLYQYLEESKPLLDEIMKVIDLEQYECEMERVKYREKYTQPPSSNSNIQYKKQYTTFRDFFKHAEQTIQKHSSRFALLKPFMVLCTRSKYDITLEFNGLLYKTTTRKNSLLDEPIEATVDESKMMNNLEHALEQLNICKQVRHKMLTDLKSKVF
jgi:hypothetical protein